MFSKGSEETFFQRRYIDKHMKRYSMLLAIREMQIKATMRFHFISTRMAEIKGT